MTVLDMHPVQNPGRPVGVVHRPRSLEAALQLLAENPDRRPLAGGTDILLDLARSGPGAPVELVDLTALRSFDEIADADGYLVMSGGVRHGQVVADDRFIQFATPLAQACLEIGSPQLRNRATIAGNLATASPANDTLSALIALKAEVQLSSWDGSAVITRKCAVVDFLTGFRTTDRRPEELITQVAIPKLKPGQEGVWVKLGNRRAQAISVVHAAFVITRDQGGVVTEAAAALGSLAATVVDASAGLAGIVGGRMDDESVRHAGGAIAAMFTPIDDVRATARYRSMMIAPIVERALAAIRDGNHKSQWPQSIPALVVEPDPVSAATPTTDLSIIEADSTIGATVNGEWLSGSKANDASLMDWLRDSGMAAGRTLDGTKEGCAEGECGACTVQLNGAAVMSCIVAAAQADGATLVTIEGLAAVADPQTKRPVGEEFGESDLLLHNLQQAFIDEFAVQCGYCIPGFLMAGATLLKEIPDPTVEDIKLAFSGNLCRCTGYYPIIQAVHTAAQAQRSKS